MSGIPYIPVRQTVVNGGGRPYAGASRTFYQAGTTTLATVYADSGLVTPLANPQSSNSAGRFDAAYLDPANDYRVILKDASGNTLSDDDNVPTSYPIRNEITDAESAAAVTPVDYSYLEGDLRRYGETASGLLHLLRVAEQGVIGEIPGDVTVTGWTQYVTTAPIHLRGGGTITGDTIFLQPGDSVKLENLSFAGWSQIAENDSTDSGTVILEVTGCSFSGSTASAFDIETPVTRAYFANNHFSTCSNYNIRLGKDVYALQDTWTKIEIIGNTFTGITSSSTNNAAAAIVYGKEVVIANNIVNGVNSTAGSGEAHGFYTKTRQTTITGNVVTSVLSTAGSGTCCSINVKGTPRGGSTNPQGYNTLVANNVVQTSGGYGIRIQVDEAVVTGNIIEEPTYGAIILDAVSGDNVIVNGNKGYISTAGTSAGIIVGIPGNRVKVSNNIMEGFVTPISVSLGASETLTALTIDNNTLYGTTYGIRLSLDAAGTLDYCNIRGNLVQAATDGIQMPSTGTCTNLVIESNDLRAATNKINGSVPSAAVVRNNLGYVTSNAGITSAIATGATVAHGLSTTPGHVVVSAAESGPTDIYVTAVGSTTFVVNFGGGSSKTFYWRAESAKVYGA